MFMHVCCSVGFEDMCVVFRGPVDMHLMRMVHGDMGFFSLCFSCGFWFCFSKIVEPNVFDCFCCVVAGR